MPKYMYYLMVFAGGCSYGVVSTFVKLAYKHGFDIASVTATQFLAACALLWCAALFVKKEKLSFPQFGSLLLKGIPLALTGIFYNHSLQYINASVAIILLLQFTWITVLIRYVFDNIKPARINLIAIAVILTGSIAASGVIGNGFHFSLAGIVFGLLAGFSFGCFIYFSGKNTFEVHPVYKSAVVATGAAIVVFAVMPPVFFFTDLALLRGVLPYAFFTAFFGTFLSTILFNTGMPKSNGYGSILSSSEMPMAVMMSAVVLHESVGALQWLGVFIILSGIALPGINFKAVSDFFTPVKTPESFDNN